MVHTLATVQVILALTLILASCTNGPSTDSSDQDTDVIGQADTLDLGLESACKSVNSLAELTSQTFPRAVKPDETREDIDARRAPFRAELASLSAVLATIPRDLGFEEVLESLGHSAEAAFQVSDSLSAGGEEFDPSGLQRLFDVEIWGKPLKEWHSSAQQTSRLCLENQLSTEEPDGLEEGSQYFDLLPYRAWDYQASEDDFGVIRHNWTAASTTNDPFPIGNLSIFVICWDGKVVVNPSPRPYSIEAFGAVAVGRGSQGVEIAFGGGQGIWQTAVVQGTPIGLFPSEREAEFMTGDPALQSQVSKEVIEDLAQHETVSIGTEFDKGEISGKNYINGLDLVIEKMEALDCW